MNEIAEIADMLQGASYIHNINFFKGTFLGGKNAFPKCACLEIILKKMLCINQSYPRASVWMLIFEICSYLFKVITDPQWDGCSPVSIS